MNRLLFTAILSLSLIACQQQARENAGVEGAESAPVDVETLSEKEKIAYAIGASTGTYFQEQFVDFEDLDLGLNRDLFLRGLEDSLNGQSGMDEEQLRLVLTAFETQLRAKRLERQTSIDEESLAKGQAFLAENATKEGVVTLDSGLQYKVISEGEGKRPAAEDIVVVHYRGSLIDGTEFDSSYARNEPAEFGISQVIPGWTEGLQLMSKGASWQLFVPADLAYGARGTGRIPPNSVLVFDVELLDVKSPDAE